MHRTALCVAVAFGLLVTALGCSRASTAPPAAADDAGGLRFIFAERIGSATTIWAARPEEPADRRMLARLNHDPEWGIRAALSPNGRRLAYTLMPPGGRDPDRDAVLMLLHLDRRESRRLATGVDLRTTPLWSGADALIVQRAAEDGRGTLVRIALDGAAHPLATAAPGHRLYPAGADPYRAAIYVVDLAADGSVLRRIDGEGGREIARLADGPTRGFALSPDGASLAFLRLEAGTENRRYRAYAVDLADGAVRPLRPDIPRIEDTGVTWGGQGGVLITAIDEAGGSGLLLSDAAGSNRGIVTDRPALAGFDAAVAAAPDGSWLAVRAFAGGDSREPGPETLALLAAGGRRVPVTAEGGVTTIGWRQ